MVTLAVELGFTKSSGEAAKVGGNSFQAPATSPAQGGGNWWHILPWTVDGTLVSAREISEVDPVDRRSLVLGTSAVIASSAHNWLMARPVKDVSSATGRTVGPEALVYLDDMTGKLRCMDDQMGGGSLVDLVRAQAGYVADLLRDGKYTDSVGRRLHGVLAELLRLGGWVSFDSGHHPQAQRFWLAALHAAHTAGDRALGANVMGFMGEQAWSLGRLDDAIKLTETAIAGYRGKSPRVAAAHVRAREPEQACAVGTRAIDVLSGQVNSPRLTGTVRQLQKDLGPYQELAAVREFGERASQFASQGSAV